MKIAQLHIYRHDLPIRGGPYTMASATLDMVRTTVIKLVTDTGHVGWGETCPLGTTYAQAHSGGALAALEHMAPGLIGTPVAPNPVHHRMNALLMGHSYAKAAVDIATHDALARSLDVPVSTLLGGALRQSLPAYYAVGLEAPEDAARIAESKLNEGYRRLQLKAGGRDIAAVIETARAVCAVTKSAGVPLVVDANRGWRVDQTITFSHACADLPLTLEQPCSSLNEIRQLKGRLCHPVLLDESAIDLDTVAQIIGEGLTDGFGLKLTRAGGLAPMAVLRDLLASRRLKHTCDDSWGGDIVAAACLHIAATVTPDQLAGVWIAEPYINDRYDEANGPRAVNGQLMLPDAPGLGIHPNENAFTKVASYE